MSALLKLYRTNRLRLLISLFYLRFHYTTAIRNDSPSFLRICCLFVFYHFPCCLMISLLYRLSLSSMYVLFDVSYKSTPRLFIGFSSYFHHDISVLFVNFMISFSGVVKIMYVYFFDSLSLLLLFLFTIFLIPSFF